MPINPVIAGYADELRAIRRDIHAHPEIAFEEWRTAGIVAEKLSEWGIPVERGLAVTGVVGTLKAGAGTRSIALRADMDALPMPEKNDFAHASRQDGKMHACGHDGHTAMLLGAARYLASSQQFDGTVHFVFQPAEEGRGGGRVMVEEGLFERFPADAVYGMHNMPGLAIDQIAVTPGPQLASSDSWEVVFRGVGTHGGKPHLGRDAIAASGQFLTALQTIVARTVDPLDAAVVSACSIFGGDPDAWSVIPDEVTLRGTARAYRPEVRDHLEETIGRIAAGVSAALDVTAAYRFIRRNPPVVNDPAVTETAAQAAASVVGDGRVVRDFPPSTAGDDFAFLSQAVPGAYVWVGNGPAEDGRLHHNSRYEFNDEALVTGASFWAALVEQELSAER